jgi:pimeloyl-[acyl-carrier protein] methyl ester esterase
MAMTLYSESQGQGPELVLLHGWGLHGGIWGELPAMLARDYRVTTLDLPGHGRSGLGQGPLTLEILTDSVVGLIDTRAIWLGWSLGGFVALDAALRHPTRVAGLVLVGATPKFVQSPEWLAGMSPDVFAGFTDSLRQDYRGTLQRFLSLQAGSDEAGRAVIKRLRREMFAHGEPKPEALTAGLSILEHSDLRPRLAEIRVPTLVLQGTHDRLVPPAAGEFLARHIPRARLVSMAGMGHAPFLSQPEAFLETLRGSQI